LWAEEDAHFLVKMSVKEIHRLQLSHDKTKQTQTKNWDESPW
jgi:hypothetical protein